MREKNARRQRWRRRKGRLGFRVSPMACLDREGGLGKQGMGGSKSTHQIGDWIQVTSNSSHKITKCIKCASVIPIEPEVWFVLVELC